MLLEIATARSFLKHLAIGRLAKRLAKRRGFWAFQVDIEPDGHISYERPARATGCFAISEVSKNMTAAAENPGRIARMLMWVAFWRTKAT